MTTGMVDVQRALFQAFSNLVVYYTRVMDNILSVTACVNLR